jgi:two-component sensor histidine kinase
VSNVLALAAARGRSPEELALAMEGRINALGAAYALVAETSAAPTLDRLARETARRALAPAETPIIPEIDLPAGYLSLRLCSPLCLWLHETITNARIHGLAGTARPRLAISGSLGEGGLLLSVRDNGPGPPPGFDPGAASGLGLTLVQALASRDLRGEMTFLDNHPGFEARLTAPAAEIAQLNREFWI